MSDSLGIRVVHMRRWRRLVGPPREGHGTTQYYSPCGWNPNPANWLNEDGMSSRWKRVTCPKCLQVRNGVPVAIPTDCTVKIPGGEVITATELIKGIS